MKKIISISVASFVVGILVVFTGYFVYTVIQTQKSVKQNSAAINEIVNFINKQISASSPAPVTK